MFSQQDAQIAFAALGAAACSADTQGNLLQPLLVRASSSPNGSTAACPLLIALRDILQRKQNQPQPNQNAGNSNNSDSEAQQLVSSQLAQYETDLRDAERQCEPLRIARDKLKAELQRVETLLSNAETAARRSADGTLVCKSLLQSMNQNTELGFDPSAAVAQQQQNTVGGGGGGGGGTGGRVNVAAAAGAGGGVLAEQQPATAGIAHSTNTYIAAEKAMPSIPTANQQQQQQQNQYDNNSTPSQQQQPQQQQQQQQPPQQQQTQQQQQHAMPTTVEGTIEILERCHQAGHDDEHRAQLIPAIARVEARISKPGAIVDQIHAQLVATIMATLSILHESVQVHALRAVLAMLRKIADDKQIAGSLSTRLHVAGLTSCCDEPGLRTFIALFSHGHDDDVKAEVLECLGVLVGESHFVDVTCSYGIVDPLVQLIATSTSEPVLERALLLLWSLAAASDRVKEEALASGGVRALVDLLYTDSLPILDNTMIALGYLSRDERVKVALGEGGGLEKILSCLYHPNPSVLVKAAGVVWNAAVVDANRTHLRSLGAVPALLQLLRNTSSELARENIAGALWNLTVDAEAKKQVADYDGFPFLTALLSPNRTENVLENATGTLWNCSATVDNRAALRRHGALPPLLSLLDHPAERIQENAAGAIRNLVINDHNKVAVRECGGIEMIVRRLSLSWQDAKQSHQQQQNSSSSNNNNNGSPPSSAIAHGVIDKLVSTLWILTVTPENRLQLQPAMQLLLEFAASGILPLNVREKVIGTLRNCCGLQENRKPLVQLGAFAVITQFAASLGLALPTSAVPNVAPAPSSSSAGGTPTTSTTLRENLACAIWNLAREDREAGRKGGALGVVVALLADTHDNVVEPAAGAVAALINHTSNEGRNELGDLGGIDRLSNVFFGVLEKIASRPTTSSSLGGIIVLLHNTIHALRYATSSACERNISRVLDRPEDLVAKIVGLIENPVQGPPGGAVSPDDITREAILLLKNILTSADPRARQQMAKCGNLDQTLSRLMAAAASKAPSSTTSPTGDASSLLHRAAQSLQGVLRGAH